MGYYNYDRFQGGYNMGCRPSYERDNRPYYGRGYRPFYERDNRSYYDPAPVAYRQEPYYDNYRRDYRQGPSHYDDRHGVVPFEDDFGGVEAPHWMDQSRYHHRGQVGGYRLDRYDHHGGPDHGHGNFLHHQDDHRRHGDYHSSQTAVELFVPICCDKCERKLRKHLDYIDGVESITVDQTTKKVVVSGHVNPSHVLNRARQDKFGAEFWHSRPR